MLTRHSCGDGMYVYSVMCEYLVPLHCPDTEIIQGDNCVHHILKSRPSSGTLCMAFIDISISMHEWINK